MLRAFAGDQQLVPVGLAVQRLAGGSASPLGDELESAAADVSSAAGRRLRGRAISFECGRCRLEESLLVDLGSPVLVHRAQDEIESLHTRPAGTNTTVGTS